MEIKRALLVIADIGGYTRFMLATRMSLAHAHVQIASLLEAVLDGAAQLKMAKLEGDAVFFHGPDASAAELEEEIGRMRARFAARKAALVSERQCDCAACTHLEELTLKFVAHRGEVAFHRVRDSVELAGVDVILVHRMLKNDVPIKEYLLMTESVHAEQTPALREQSTSLEHDFEGIGKTATHWLALAAVATPAAAAPSTWVALVERMKLTARALPYYLGISKPLVGTRLMGDQE